LCLPCYPHGSIWSYSFVPPTPDPTPTSATTPSFHHHISTVCALPYRRHAFPTYKVITSDLLWRTRRLLDWLWGWHLLATLPALTCSRCVHCCASTPGRRQSCWTCGSTLWFVGVHGVHRRRVICHAALRAHLICAASPAILVVGISTAALLLLCCWTPSSAPTPFSSRRCFRTAGPERTSPWLGLLAIAAFSRAPPCPCAGSLPLVRCVCVLRSICSGCAACGIVVAHAICVRHAFVPPLLAGLLALFIVVGFTWLSCLPYARRSLRRCAWTWHCCAPLCGSCPLLLFDTMGGLLPAAGAHSHWRGAPPPVVCGTLCSDTIMGAGMWTQYPPLPTASCRWSPLCCAMSRITSGAQHHLPLAPAATLSLRSWAPTVVHHHAVGYLTWGAVVCGPGDLLLCLVHQRRGCPCAAFCVGLLYRYHACAQLSRCWCQ